MTIFAGWISPEDLAANTILFNIVYLLFQFPLGLSFSACNFIGNSLGEKKPNVSKKYWIVSTILFMIMALVFMTIMLIFRNQVPYIYTSESKVASIVSSLMVYLCLMLFFDFGQGVLSGAIRGIGKQDFGSIMSLISYWIIMLPLCYLFAFTFDFGVIGIWIGVPIGAV